MRTAIQLILLGIVVAWSSGCATFQQWVGDSDCECDCEAVATCPSNDDEVARALVAHQVDVAHYRAQLEGERTAQFAAQAEADEGDARSPDEFAYEPVNPMVEDSVVALDEEAQRTTFEDSYGIAVTDEVQAFRAPFAEPEQPVVAVHRPGESLAFFDEGTDFLSVDFDAYDPASIPEDATRFTPGVVDLLRDDTMQLQLVHAARDESGSITYYMAIYKIIGDHVGTIFQKPIATRSSDGELTMLADLRYLHGVDQRIIEWIPLGPDETPQGEPIHYEWNPWEGVYRVPKPPPTAPRDPQS